MEKTEKDIKWYSEFGRKRLGPFLYAYTDWLYSSVKDDGIDKVFFFARDGYLMEKAFRIFNEHYASDINTKYVYFSRKSIRQAMLWHCEDYETSLKYLYSPAYISLGEILEYYGYTSSECRELSDKYTLKPKKEFKYSELKHNAEIKKLYYNLKKEIDKKSKEQDRLLLQYIKQIDMSGRFAIVDIGWHGRMQLYLEQYFQLHGLNAAFLGYYLGMYPLVALNNPAKGFIFGGDDLRMKNSILCFLGGYEKLFQSYEGSTQGYLYADGSIKPVLGRYEYENEKDIISYTRAYQYSALKYVEKAIKAGLKTNKKMINPLVSFGKHPSLRDTRMFSFWYIDDGNIRSFISHKSLFKYSIMELVHAMGSSAWKTGFMKSILKLPLPYYFIYCICKK